MKSFFKWLVGLALTFAALAVMAAPINVPGGSEQHPKDITNRILANQDINFTGGHYVINLPQGGVGVVPAISVDPVLNRIGNNGFSTADNPTIKYTGVISGNGQLRVRSGFNAERPLYGLFNGGVLVFTNVNGQKWALDGAPSGGRSAPALMIDSNVTVEFLDENETAPSYIWPLDEARSRNIVNNGYMYVSAKNSWASITGTGINVFQYGGGNGALRGPQGAIYSGQLFDFNSGTQIHWGAVFENQPNGQPTTIESSDITVYVSKRDQFLTLPASYKKGDPVVYVSQNIHMSALNIMLWNTGIHHFTGTILPPSFDKNHLELASFADAVQAQYHYGAGSKQGFGRVINLTNRVTLHMGEGQDIVTNPDGFTNNTFIQGNPFNSLLSTNNFESRWSGYTGEAMAFNYSGSYRVNFNMNAAINSSSGRPIIQGIRNNDWVNLLLLDPKEWNPNSSKPNHAIVTTPVFLAGLTRIDKNSVLQLGDGTVGIDLPSKTATASNGLSITSSYSPSSGNGMLMTLGNHARLPKSSVMNASVIFEIVNNGKLVVNNTQDALNATTAHSSAEVAAWVKANQLDGIRGSGSVEQKGSLPLVLGSESGNPNAYSGGTMIRSGSRLIVGSATALGARDATITARTGNVLNNGRLEAAKGVRTINVPGNYSQVASAADASAN